MMKESIQEALDQVLAIEREAGAILEDARARASAAHARGSQEADEARRRVLDEARRQAEQVVASARAEAEEERDRRLAEADREVDRLERLAQERQAAAVRLVVQRLLGQVAAPPGPVEARPSRPAVREERGAA